MAILNKYIALDRFVLNVFYKCGKIDKIFLLK